MSKKRRFKVTSSPWPENLPVGTIMVEAFEDEKGRMWYKREDGVNATPKLNGVHEREDGCVVLWSSELETV